MPSIVPFRVLAGFISAEEAEALLRGKGANPNQDETAALVQACDEARAAAAVDLPRVKMKTVITVVAARQFIPI